MLTAMKRRRHAQAGFTLTEVVAALAILALSLSVAWSLISNGIRQTGDAETLAAAGSLAQSLLDEVGAGVPLQAGETAGQFPNGLRWRVRTEAYGNGADRQQWPVGAYRVSAEVFWGDGVRARSVALSTLRLGPKEPAR